MSDEAWVETAAEALWRHDNIGDSRRFDQVDLKAIENLCSYARAVLAAVEPLIRDQLAQAWKAGHRTHAPQPVWYGETPCECANPYEGGEA